MFRDPHRDKGDLEDVFDGRYLVVQLGQVLLVQGLELGLGLGLEGSGI
jgi:hypothetical protein